MAHTHNFASPRSQSYFSPSGRSSTPTSTGIQTPNSSTASVPSSASSKPKPKPVNVFSNDGSFLERVQRTKLGEEEKKKVKKDLKRKVDFEDRFKNRGKRISPPPEDENEHSSTNSSPLGTSNSGSGASTTGTPEEPPLKKSRADEQADAYQKEMRNFENSTGGLSSTDTGSRLLVK